MRGHNLKRQMALSINLGLETPCRGRRNNIVEHLSLRNSFFGNVTLITATGTIDVIARRRYPMPDADMDLDLVYDPGIRADLMCRVLSDYAWTGFLTTETKQTPTEGRTFFVIHPVLKHIARLSLEMKLT